MKHVAIIQARMGSSRLPGKVLKPLAGRPVLTHVVERCSRAACLDEVVVATTTDPRDDVLVDYCQTANIPVVRGSEDDVLSRYFKAAEERGADLITRITSDCPLIDPGLIDRVAAARAEADADYAALFSPRTFPRGLDNECFTMDSFRTVKTAAILPEEKVHVTPHYYLNPDRFHLVPVVNDTDLSALRWTLDTPEDYAALSAIFDHFGGRNDMDWTEVLDLVTRQPEITAMNAHIEQKALKDL